MQVKLVKAGGEETTYPASHINKITLTGTEVQREAGYEGEGIVVTLFPDGTQLRLPDDGDAIYVIDSETGKTTHKYSWPEKGATHG